jgi:hypothetical protein
VFLSVWFGLAMFWTGTAAHYALGSEQAEDWWSPLAGLGMFFAGFALVAMGRFFARNDVAWLSSVIRGALSAAAHAHSPSRPGSRGDAA